MPRPRARRPPPCDCFDCAEGEAEGGQATLTNAATAASTSTLTSPVPAIRMEPPPRALLIIGDGLLTDERAGEHAASPSSLDSSRPLPHLDGLARAGGAGLLMLERGRRGIGEEEEAGAAGCLPPGDAGVLAQLLGVAEVREGQWSCGRDGPLSFFPCLALTLSPHHQTHGALTPTALSLPAEKHTHSQALEDGTPPPTLESRFQGMAVALLVGDDGSGDGEEWREVAEAAGLRVHPLLEPGSPAEGGDDARPPSLPPPVSLAARIARLLHLAQGGDGDDDDDGGVDAVFVRVPPPPSPSTTTTPHLAWIDALLASVGRLPGGRTALITCVILGGDGRQRDGGGTGGGIQLPAHAGGEPARPPLPSTLPPVARPAQTWEDGARGPPARCLYLAARLAGVVRTDGLAEVDPAGAAAGGALGTTRAAHLLPELAYKMGRAPKYGA
jgi:hypothetical protein